jgi:hypothetical protein
VHEPGCSGALIIILQEADGRGSGRRAKESAVSHALTVSPASGWQQARRKAFVDDALAAFARRPIDLLDFEQVSQKLRLSTVLDRGLQTVALNQIVGSVGRYTEFTRAFLPRADSLQERWQRIEQMVATGRAMPPVDLYKVGEAYFVRDGNHRVSVARQRRWATINAYVLEFEGCLALRPDVDVDSQLRVAAHAAFMACTHLDRLCPDANIRLIEPGDYEELLHEIEAYRLILRRIDECEIPADEATVLWYEMRYLPIVDTIRGRCVLEEFPGRTETDLYLWLVRNLEELESRYGHRVSLGEAADDLTGRFGGRLLPIRSLKQAARRVKGFAQDRAATWQRSGRRAIQQRRTRHSRHQDSEESER